MPVDFYIHLNALQFLVNSTEFDNTTFSTIKYWSEAHGAIVSLGQVSSPRYNN